MVCAWLWTQSAIQAAPDRPDAGPGGPATAGAVSETDAPPVARNPGKNLVNQLSAADLATAQRLEDVLQDLLSESLARQGAALDLTTYKIGGLTPYADVFLLAGPDPIVDITIGAGADGFTQQKLKAASATLKAIPGVLVLGVASTDSYGLISAAVPPARLLAVAGVPGTSQVLASGAVNGSIQSGDGVEDLVSDLTRSIALLAEGAIGNQAEEALDVDDARRVFNPNADDPNGDGIEIGTLSDSVNLRNGIPGDGFTGIDESQNTGDLPADARIFVHSDLMGGGATDEGRAMMEHIFDIAPSVDRMGFSSASNGEATFGANITALGTNGMNIINDDVVYFAEPYFQDGVIAQAVANYVAGGGIYFALNHNFGNLSYEDVWTNADGDSYHEYAPGDEVLMVNIAAGRSLRLGLQWTQPWGAATTDLKLVIWNAALTTILAESGTNNIGGNPYDSLTYNNNTGSTLSVYVCVSRVSGSATGLTLKYIAFDNGARNIDFVEHTGDVAGTLTPHAGAPSSIAVGASPWYNRDVAENYSGRGPHRRFFTAGGTPTGPFTYQKPDILGVDGCNTTFFGNDIAEDADTRPNFFGTSAATPNTAAIAALMLDVAGGPGTLDQADIRTLMGKTAVDLGTSGHDIVYGNGRVNALGAVCAAAGPFAPEYSLYPNQFGDATFSQNLYNDTDIDRFQYVTDVSGTVQLDVIESTVVMDPMVAVFRQSDEEFIGLDYDRGTGDDARFSYNAAYGTLYTAEVMSQEPFAGSANFHIDLNGPTPGVSGVVLDSFGDATVNGNLYVPRDLDYYRVYAPNDLTGGLTVACTPTGFDSYLLLYNAAGSLIAWNNSGASGGVDTISYGAVSPGQEFVILVAASGYAGSGDFDLSVNFVNAPGQPVALSPFPASTTYTVRPNPVTGSDTISYPSMSEGGTYHALWVPDSDSQTIFSSTNYLFDSITGGLYNLAGTRLVVGGPSNAFTLNTAVTENDSYLYRLRGAGDWNIIIIFPRALSIDATATFTETPAPADLVSPVSLTDSGAGYVYHQTSDYRIQEPGDQDFFEVVIPANAQGSMTLDMYMDGSLDGMFQLYDSAGTLLITRNGGGSAIDESYTYGSATPGATYYIRLTNADASATLNDTTQRGDYTFRITIPIIVPTLTPGPSPTPSLTPTASLTPTPSLTPTASATPSISPTASPTAVPPCEDVRVAFSFEEPTRVIPSTLNGGHHGDIMVSPGKGEVLAHVLVPHKELISAFDPRDPDNIELSIENVGLDALDLISFPRYEKDSTLLRVFWSSEIDFQTGPKSVLGPGRLIRHGALLTNTGAVFPNILLLKPFVPTDPKGGPIEGNFGLDGLDVEVDSELFDSLDPDIYRKISFPVAFSFEEIDGGGVVDEFTIGDGPDKGRVATHGDILYLPDVTVLRTNADLVENMEGEKVQHGLDGIDNPRGEGLESGAVALKTKSWFFSVEDEIEMLKVATGGDVLEEATGIFATNSKITGDRKEYYGLDGIDIVCGPEIILPTPTPTASPTPSLTPESSPTPSPSLTPSLSPTASPSPIPVCLDPRVVFSFEEPGIVKPTDLNGGHHGDVMISGALDTSEKPTVLIPHTDLIKAFDPRDPQNPKVQLDNVGLDGLDLISYPFLDPKTPVRIFWTASIDFVTGAGAAIGEGVLIHHGDLLTNTGAVFPNAVIFEPFDPRDPKGNRIEGDFGLDGVELVVRPEQFDKFTPEIYKEVPFELFISFEEIDGGGVVDQFTIGAGPQKGEVTTHGDILALPAISIARSQKNLTGELKAEGEQHGLDAIDLPKYEEIESGPVELGRGDWLFSVEEFETLLNEGHGDVIEENLGTVVSNHELSKDKENEYGLDALDVVCVQFPVPPTPTATRTPGATGTPTATPPPTGTPDLSPTPSMTAGPTLSPTPSMTLPPTPSPSLTPSPSETPQATSTQATPTPTASITPTISPTRTPGPGDSDGDGISDQYENDHGSDPFDPDSFPEVLDVNGDGELSLDDAVNLYQILIGLLPLPPGFDRGAFDFNGDGQVNSLDAMLFYRNQQGNANVSVIPLP